MVDREQTPSPGYRVGRTDDERAAYWAQLEREQALADERARVARQNVLACAAMPFLFGGLVMAAAASLYLLGAIDAVPALLAAILVVLIVIATRLPPRTPTPPSSG